MRTSLLIINSDQFGYHTDSYKYCQYLRDEFDITYLCFDAERPKYELEGVTVIYVKRTGTYIRKGFSFINFANKQIVQNNFGAIFMVYFPLCFMIKLITKKNIILDIRTGSVEKSSIARKLFNTLLKLETTFFRHITIISKSLAEMLGIQMKKVKVIPLGADVISDTSKNFDYPRLFYVGTLFHRNIHKTVIGFKKFLEAHDFEKKSYDIFGFGLKSDEDLLIQTIAQNNLGNVVKFHGRKSHQEIKSYFDNCNIGVSFVPMTKYFQCQPPTKTYEYINSGMVCIATNTYENKLLINKSNGVLCNDDPAGFSEGLTRILKNKEYYNSNTIRTTLKENNWETIAIRLGIHINSLIHKE